MAWSRAYRRTEGPDDPPPRRRDHPRLARRRRSWSLHASAADGSAEHMSSSPRKPTSRRGGRQTPGPGKKLGAPPSARGYVTLAPRVLPEHRAALDRLARRVGVGDAA